MRHAAFSSFALACLFVLALAACGDDQVRQVGPAIRVVSTHVDADGSKLIDFGPVPVLITEERKLLVYNDGLAALTVRSASIQTEDDAFRIDPLGPNGLRVEPGSEQAILVYFQPPAQKDYVGTLTLEHDDANEPPVTVRLIGTGSTVGRIEVSPRQLDFGRVGERTQVVRTLSIRSVGSARLILESIVLDGAPEFSLLGSTTTPAPLEAPEGGNPGGSVDLLVACSPTEATEEDALDGTLTIRSTDPDNREIVVDLTATVNRAPVAVIAEPGGGVPAPGDPVGLDGSASHDTDGDDPVSFLWRVYRKPLGSEAYIDDPEASAPALVTDMAGTYVVGLDVADSTGLSCLHPNDDPMVPCATREIVVKPSDDLYFELVWDHPDTDLDLHLLDHGAPLYSARDCYHGNPAPDFGEFGNALDDPRHTRDDLRGFGPERVIFSKPPAGTFDVAVVFAKSNGAPDPASTATVRVFVYGVLEAEMSAVLDTKDQVWHVLSLEWPSAAIAPIDEIEDPPSTETQP